VRLRLKLNLEVDIVCHNACPVGSETELLQAMEPPIDSNPIPGMEKKPSPGVI